MKTVFTPDAGRISASLRWLAAYPSSERARAFAWASVGVVVA